MDAATVGAAPTDDTTIVSYFETFTGNAARIIYWGKTTSGELLVAVNLTNNSETITFDRIEVRHVIEYAVNPAAELIVENESLRWGINPGNIALNGLGQFRLSRALTTDDDEKLFVGSIRYNNHAHDDAGRAYDRIPLPAINARRLRNLYNRPTKERVSETQSFEPLDRIAGAIRFVQPRVGHEVESALLSIVSFLYSGEHITYVNGEVSASGTSIVVDDASDIMVGDTLIVHGSDGTNDFTEFIEVTAISGNTLTVTRNQAGTYVHDGVRTILDDEPVYRHDMRTFFAVATDTGTGMWDDFDAYLYSYGDDPYGIESVNLNSQTLELERRDGTTLEQSLSTIASIPSEDGVSQISGQLSEVTLWIEVAEGTTPERSRRGMEMGYGLAECGSRRGGSVGQLEDVQKRR